MKSFIQTPNPQKIAIFDIDGTICDYVGAMKAALGKLRAPGDFIIFRLIDFISPKALSMKLPIQSWKELPLQLKNRNAFLLG